MSKNPFLNAIAALGYIVLVAFIMQTGGKTIPHTKSFLAPVAFISLFTLSAAIMGYLFGFQPATLYLDGKKKQAVGLFLKTVLTFGCITLTLLLLLFTGIIR